MEFRRGDIVVITVEHPDGSKTVTKDDIGVITEKVISEFGINYIVHTWRNIHYVYGADQLRLATQEEKDVMLINLMMK